MTTALMKVQKFSVIGYFCNNVDTVPAETSFVPGTHFGRNAGAHILSFVCLLCQADCQA